MATDKKHIAVYLAPEIEHALIAFCEQKGLKSKKGIMFSAGVNAVLAEFFGVSVTEASNVPRKTGNRPVDRYSDIPANSNILIQPKSNIPAEIVAVEVLPGKSLA